MGGGSISTFLGDSEGVNAPYSLSVLLRFQAKTNAFWAGFAKASNTSSFKLITYVYRQ